MEKNIQFNTGFTLRYISGTSYIVDPGKGSADLSYVYTLSETAAFLFERFGHEKCTVDDLVEALVAEFDGDPNRMRQDVEQLLDFMEKHNFFKR